MRCRYMLAYKKFILVWVVFMLIPLSTMAGGMELGRQYCSGTLPIIFINLILYYGEL